MTFFFALRHMISSKFLTPPPPPCTPMLKTINILFFTSFSDLGEGYSRSNRVLAMPMPQYCIKKLTNGANKAPNLATREQLPRAAPLTEVGTDSIVHK